MRLPIFSSRVKNFAVIASIYIGLVLFSSGCNSRGNCPEGPFISSCTATVPEPGIYMATYEDSEGNEQTTEITVGDIGADFTLLVCDCTKIIGDPIFIGPPGNRRPNCSSARASVETLPNDGNFHEVSILVDDPDGETVGLRIDNIEQDEPISGLFEGDKCPDAQLTSPSTFRLRGERSPAGNGRVYRITFTASDGNGGICRGFAKVCVPSETGGGCAGAFQNVDFNSANDSLCSDEVRNADLSISVSALPEPAVLGEILKYEITLTNNGPSDATGVSVTFPLPAGVGYLDDLSSDACSRVEGAVICSLGKVEKSKIEQLEISVRPTLSGPFTGTFSAGANEIDPNTGNNTAAITTQVNPGPDLAVTIIGSPNPVRLGAHLTYTIFVRNDGPIDAENVVLKDNFNMGLFGIEFVSPTITTTQGSCTLRPFTDEMITCELGSLASGEQATVILNADLLSIRAVTSNEIVYTVTASTSSADFDPSNNTAAAKTNILFANLSVNITDSPDPVTLGSPLTYTITVRNNGPDAATGIALRNTLPGTAAFVSAAASQGSCPQQGQGLVACNLGTLANGSSATVSITVIPQLTTGMLSASAEATNIESSIGAVSDLESTTVNEAATTADLSVTIADSPDPATRLSLLTYTVTVTNNGPTAATGVVLTQTLPNFSEGAELIPSQGSAARSRLTITCNFGSIAAGSSATLTVNLTPLLTGAFTTTATVTANESDPNTGNNAASASTTVNP